MENVKRGEIVDYETDAGPVPMLVVHVNDQENGDGAVVGVVFHTDGTTESVTIHPDAPDPEPTPEEIESLRAKLAEHDAKTNPPTDTPVPVVSAPTSGGQ